MRIIAGDRRGMKLLSPTSDISRPITDRVKESLFNVLQKYDLPKGKVVADLFSGVGSLGLECLEQGRPLCQLCRKRPQNRRHIEEKYRKGRLGRLLESNNG